MNNTTNSSSEVIDYVNIVANILTLIISSYMSYQLGHFQLRCNESYCCGRKCCPEWEVEFSEESKSH